MPLLILGCGEGAHIDPHDARGKVDASDAQADRTIGEVAGDTIRLDAQDVHEPQTLFDGGELLQIEIWLEGVAPAVLALDPSNPVAIRLHIDGAPVEVARLTMPDRGDLTRDLSGKATFVLHLYEATGSARVRGLKQVTLDPMLNDPSHVREQLAVMWFGVLGLPAPGGAYAWVRVNDEVFGLYSAVESIDGERFMERAFGETEGPYFAARNKRADVQSWMVAEFQQIQGGQPGIERLDALASAVTAIDQNTSKGDGFDTLAALSEHIDMSAYLQIAAADVVIGRRHNYQWRQRGYGLYYSDLDARWSIVPEAPFTSVLVSRDNPWSRGGRIHRVCLDSLGCRARYAQVLQRALDLALEHRLYERAYGVASAVRRWLADDPRREAPMAEVDAAIDAALANLVTRRGWIEANMPCADPTQVDRDGDGFSGCTDDCNDDNASVHPGAAELCNLRDDDCNSLLDDDDACPGCAPFTASSGQVYDLCYRRLDWPSAREDCRTRGGTLATLTDATMAHELTGAAFDLQFTGWWIGLSDTEEEGVFAWDDGTPLTWESWNNNEPNDNGAGEDCVHVTPWSGGRWNDLACRSHQNYICAFGDPDDNTSSPDDNTSSE